MLSCGKVVLGVVTEIGQEDPGSGIANLIGGIVGMNTVPAPDLGALIAEKLKNTQP